MTTDHQATSQARYGDRIADAVRATIAFFADDNRATRYLARHQPGVDGRCRGCRRAYPCSLIEMAKAGADLAVKRQRRGAT